MILVCLKKPSSKRIFTKPKSSVKDIDITGLLTAWSKGDDSVEAPLMSAVYGVLRRLAQKVLSGESLGHTLQATEIVNEAYLRLVKQRGVPWQNRNHFFAIAAKMMRRILVDHTRRRCHGQVIKVGEPLALDSDFQITSNLVDPELLSLDRALSKLGKKHPKQAQLVELRFFAGLTISEAATFLAISEATANRDWRMARAWLYREMTKGVGDVKKSY